MFYNAKTKGKVRWTKLTGMIKYMELIIICFSPDKFLGLSNAKFLRLKKINRGGYNGGFDKIL